jgi:tight adherence protein B
MIEPLPRWQGRRLVGPLLRWQRRRAIRRRRRSLITSPSPPALAAALEAAAREVRAGTALRLALAAQSAVIPAALALSRGEPLGATLDAWTSRAASEHERMAAMATALSAHAGGAAALALDTAAVALRERAAAEAEARAQASTAMLSALIVGGLPIAFVVFTITADKRTSAVLVGTSAGWVCLAVGGFLDLVGMLWMRRLVRSVARL